MTLRLNVPGRGVFPVSGLEDASTLYTRLRSASGEGASTFPVGYVGSHTVSYNGRVWLGTKLVLEAPVKKEESWTKPKL